MSYERELVKRIGDLNDRHEHEEWLDDAFKEYGEAMRNEEFEEMQKVGEKAWDELEDTPNKCPECDSNLQCSVEDCYYFCSCKCGYEDFGLA